MTAPMSYSVHSTNTELKIWTTTATTNAAGALTVTIPDGAFTTVLGVHATCVRDTVNPVLACFAQVRSFDKTSVVVQVFESKTSGVLLGGAVEGLEATATSTTVVLTVFGS